MRVPPPRFWNFADTPPVNSTRKTVSIVRVVVCAPWMKMGVPIGPAAGTSSPGPGLDVNWELNVGGWEAITWNSPELTATPPGVTPTTTPVAPVKWSPLIRNLVPTGPAAGANVVTTGAGDGSTVNGALVSVPPAVVMVIGPVPAPWGTVTCSSVSLTTLKSSVSTVP